MGRPAVGAAARKYDRIVQHGTQGRSAEGYSEGVQKLREGVIGDVYLARGLCFKWRDTIGIAPVEPVPAGVDYDLWTGPAPLKPFTRNRFHYNWHWIWDTGNGDLGNQGVHEVDMARWGLGVKFPNKVSAIGGHFMFDDDQETPNTLNCAFEFDMPDGKKRLLEFEVRHWMTNTKRRSACPGSEQARPHCPDAGAAAAAGPSFNQTEGHVRESLLRLEGIYGHDRATNPIGPGSGEEQSPAPAPRAAETVGPTSSTASAAARKKTSWRPSRKATSPPR